MGIWPWPETCHTVRIKYNLRVSRGVIFASDLRSCFVLDPVDGLGMLGGSPRFQQEVARLSLVHSEHGELTEIDAEDQLGVHCMYALGGRQGMRLDIQLR